MLGNILPPYHSLQELNLDWILTKIKNMLRFLPDDGAVGQILRRTPHGAEWSDEQGAGGSVTSVNGMQGAVVLGAADVGALPDTYTAPVDSVNGQTGAVVLSIPSDTSDLTNGAGFVDAAGAAAAAPVQSVNSQTGAVVLSIPTDTADLTNTAGYVDAAGAAAAAPVQSVNGQTGAVVIPVSAGSITELYSGTWTSGSVALGHAYTDYDIIVIVSVTNVQQFYDFFIVGYEQYGSLITLSHSSDPINTGFTYNAMINMSITDSTHFNINANTYNNANWSLKIRAVLGISL